MCSGSGNVQSDAQQEQNLQLATSKTMAQNYNTTFAQQQGILQQQKAVAQNMIANPTGLTPQEMATSTTSINENTARAAKQAMGAAAGFAASHGGADVGSGATGQIAGEIASEAAQSKAGQLANLSNTNQAVKRANLLQGINLLQNTGAAYGGQSETGIGNEGGVVNAGTDAGKLSLQAGQTGFNDVMEGLQAAGSVAATAGSGGFGAGAQNLLGGAGKTPSPCWIAAAVFDEPMFGPRVVLVRRWLQEVFEPSSALAHLLVSLYRQYGERAAKVITANQVLKFAFRKLFDRALDSARNFYER